MGVVVERSARSPLLVEGRDFSLGIYDADGTLLEQTEYIPVLGYATTPAMRAIAECFGDNVAEGDVVLHNDPYTGGNQLSDWKVAKPVFHEGEHVAWVVIAPTRPTSAAPCRAPTTRTRPTCGRRGCGSRR